VEVNMLVDLRELKPNPMRDMRVDPIDDDRVADLKASIEEDGFWGGIVCRQIHDGTIQIGFGHHRVKAAVQAGVYHADVCVRNGDMDDGAMARIYARENATQRGNTGTAQVGSVAAAVRYLAKGSLTGQLAEIRQLVDGIGWGTVLEFLRGVPGIDQNTTKQALANLKASGDYARIIREVQEEIERENAEALAELAAAEAEKKEAEEQERKAEAERREAAAKAKAARQEADRKRAELDRQRAEAEAKLAEKRRKEADEQMEQFEDLKRTRDTAAKATEAAARKPVTFDFEGVAKHLKNAHQIDVFRQVVTGDGIAPYLPVRNQAALAADLVALAKAGGKSELTGSFIRDKVASMVFKVKTDERRMTKEEKERIEREDAIQRFRNYQREASGGLRSFMTAGSKINDLLRRWPAGVPLPISGEFRSAVESAKKVLDTLIQRI
jgi:hypothetical protein